MSLILRGNPALVTFTSNATVTITAADVGFTMMWRGIFYKEITENTSGIILGLDGFGATSMSTTGFSQNGLNIFIDDSLGTGNRTAFINPIVAGREYTVFVVQLNGSTITYVDGVEVENITTGTLDPQTQELRIRGTGIDGDDFQTNEFAYWINSAPTPAEVASYPATELSAFTNAPTHRYLPPTTGAATTLVDLAGSNDMVQTAGPTTGDNAPEFAVGVLPDTTIPVITLIGSASITQEVGGTYTEQGATASDDTDGGITGNIIVAGDTVDPATIGTYTVTYNVSDSAGNPAVQVTRDVIIEAVVDTTLPVITLLGSSTVANTIDDAYVDAGATASDNVDGDITVDIVTVNPVDTSTLGTYIITYNVSDAAGNAANQVIRTVNIEERISNIAVSGIPDGPQNLFLINQATDVIAYNGDATFSGGSTNIALNATLGDILKGYVDDGSTTTPIGGRVLKVV